MRTRLLLQVPLNLNLGCQYEHRYERGPKPERFLFLYSSAAHILSFWPVRAMFSKKTQFIVFSFIKYTSLSKYILKIIILFIECSGSIFLLFALGYFPEFQMCLMLQVDRFNLRLILPFLRANFRH